MDLQYSANKIWIENEEGKTVGEVDFFQDEQGNYDIVHTEVDDSLRGQGAARYLHSGLLRWENWIRHFAAAGNGASAMCSAVGRTDAFGQPGRCRG